MSDAASPLRRFLVRRCSATTMERLVDPILSDIQIEAAAAAAREQLWASRWIWMAGTLALIKALVLHNWTHFWRIQHWPADDRRALGRTLAYSAAATAVAIPLLILPFLLPFPAGRAPELAPYLVPQALPIALPVGLFIGLIYGFRVRILSLRPRTALMGAAMLCSAASFVALAWVVPASNQAFRVAAARDSFLPKGLQELTLGELRSVIDLDERDGLDASESKMTYHTRLALAAAPIVLTAWAFLLIGRLPARGRWLLGIVAIASCVAYSSLMSAGREASLREMLPPIAGAWLPNAAFMGALILLARRTSNDERRTAGV
jgi:hypothetical protein